MNNILASVATFLGTLAAAPQAAPWVRALGLFFANLYLRLAYAMRHILVVWFRETTLVSAAVELVVFNLVIEPSYEKYGIGLPWWFPWLHRGMVLANVVCYALDRTVLAQGGPHTRHVFRTLRLSLGSLLVMSWVWGWIGCDLNHELLHGSHDILRRAQLAHAKDLVGWAAGESRIIGEVSLFVLVPLAAIWTFGIDMLAAIFRGMALLEGALRSAGISYVAGLHPGKEEDEIRQEMVDMFGYDVFRPTTQVISVNVITWMYQLPAFVLVERVAMLVWMDAMLSFNISVAWVIGAALHLAAKAFQKKVLQRIEHVEPWTFLPLVGSAIATLYLLVVGPHRELIEVPGVNATVVTVQAMHQTFRGMNPITYLLFITTVLGYLAITGIGVEKVWKYMAGWNKWLKGTMIAAVVIFVAWPTVYQLAGVATWTGPQGLIDGFVWVGSFDWGRWWGVGKPILPVIVVFAALFAWGGTTWKLGSVESQKAGGWVRNALAGAAVVLLFTSVFFGFTRPVEAATVPLGASPGVYIIGTSTDPNCTRANNTPNGPSMCCAGTVFLRTQVGGICAPLGGQY